MKVETILGKKHKKEVKKSMIGQRKKKTFTVNKEGVPTPSRLI